MKKWLQNQNQLKVTWAISRRARDYAFVSAVNNVGIESPASPNSVGILLLDPNGDQDGDGMNNASEEIAATNPLDANSALRITGLSNGNLLTWASASNTTYQIVAATNPITTFLDVAPANAVKFYRVQVIP